MHLLNVYRVLLSFTELMLLLFVNRQNSWVNPGLGMFGWATAFSASFPLEEDICNLAHVVLGIVSALSMAVIHLNPSVTVSKSSSSLFKRFLSAVLFVIGFNYPIYNIKHWYGGAHLANFGGEYMPVFAVFSALFIAAIGPVEDVTPTITGKWPFLGWFNSLVMFFLVVGMCKFLFDLSRCRESWEMPSTETNIIPQDCVFTIVGVDLIRWGKVAICSAYMGSSCFLFVLSERLICLHRSSDERVATPVWYDENPQTRYKPPGL